MDRSTKNQATDATWPAEVQHLVLEANTKAQASGTNNAVAEDGVTRASSFGVWLAGATTVTRFESVENREHTGSVIARLSAAGFPVGAILGHHDRWLVTERLVGTSAGRPDHHADPDDLVVAVGEGLRRLHELPASALEGPGPTGWNSVIERCRQVVESETVASDELAYPYNQYSPGALLAMMEQGRPQTEEAVCCHGAAMIEGFVVSNGTFTGFERLDSAMLADRHLDLATMHRSIQDLLGPEAVFRFYDAYGADPDLVRLDHYILASQLLDLPWAATDVSKANS